MEAAKTMSALDAGDAQRVMQLAGADQIGVESISLSVKIWRRTGLPFFRPGEGSSTRSADCIKDEAVGAGQLGKCSFIVAGCCS